MSSFPWIPIYRELARRLLAYRERQEELVAILGELREQELPVILIADKISEDDDHSTQLNEIDPFTFFASFNRTDSFPNRSKILAALKDTFGLRSPVPDTFEGIPIVNAQASWFFGYQFKREETDIPLLWDLAEKIIQAEDPGDIPVELFDRCLDIYAVGRAKLTMGLFWTRPELCLPLDKNTRTYLGRRGLDADPRGGEEYVALLEDAQKQLGEPFYVVSRQAYLEAEAAQEQQEAAQDTAERPSRPEVTPQLPAAGGLDTWLLERAAARTLRPYLVEAGALEDVAVEGYHHQKVIPAVQAALTRRRLEEEPVAAASEAIKASSNLLSSYEQMKALALFETEGPEAVRTHLVDFLYGEDDLEARLGRALAWGEARAVR